MTQNFWLGLTRFRSSTSSWSLTSAQVTAIVRKELAVAIRDLMHHGLNQVDGEGDDNGDGHPSPIKK